MNFLSCICLIFAAFFVRPSNSEIFNRTRCHKIDPERMQSDLEQRLAKLRHEISTSELAALIITPFDERQNLYLEESPEHLQWLTGHVGYAVITAESSIPPAFWTDASNLEVADRAIGCQWKIFSLHQEITIGKWLSEHISTDALVGVDPSTISHQHFAELKRNLNRQFLKLIKIDGSRFLPNVNNSKLNFRDNKITTHNSTFSGTTWQNKINTLRGLLQDHGRFDGMVVTSLTEIAYILNLRGNEYKYVPVFKSFMIVTHTDVVLYTNRTKISKEVEAVLHFDMKTNSCFISNCAIIKSYDEIFKDLPHISSKFRRILLPVGNAFDMGASEAVYQLLDHEVVFEGISPIMLMRSVKNKIEREGMRNAHIKDAVAVIETLNYLKERYISGETLTEKQLDVELARSRYEQNFSRGLSFRTNIAYGVNSKAINHVPTATAIHDDNILLLDSGGQYLDGTTAIARTIHLGEPTANLKEAYTRVLMGLIRLSKLVFPENIKACEVDAIVREPLWAIGYDYGEVTGFGIGSYLDVEESPILISACSKKVSKYSLKDGMFLTVAPAFYTNDFGIKLKNVYEIVQLTDKAKRNFLRFKSITLVPFAPHLIEPRILSHQERKWLNEYNAVVRTIVGDELKKQFKMPAFYWMMNQTEHIREYLTLDDIKNSSSGSTLFNASEVIKFKYLLGILLFLFYMFCSKSR